jgi:hypothetical protein
LAITTYAELQAAAASWLVRSDLTARIVEFIALGEARLNRVVRGRQMEAEASLTATPGSRTITLPAAFSEPLACWVVIDGERCGLTYADPLVYDATAVKGQPQFWGIDGANLAFERPCDQAYSFVLRYLAKLALSDDQPTNWLLTSHPDAYLFATLAEAGPFLRDAELASAYEQKLTRALGEIKFKEGRGRAMQPLRTEPGELLAQGRNGGFNILTGA